MEDEEAKKIALEINDVERVWAMDCCAKMGFTLENTPGVDDIQPRALGMKGVDVDFSAIEPAERRTDIKKKSSGTKRIDLSQVPKDAEAEFIPSARRSSVDREPDEFIKIDVGEGQEVEPLNYNHRLRRKLRRALDAAQIQKEILVRERALAYCVEKNVEPPAILRTPNKPKSTRWHRILENGTLETDKKERGRGRMELTEYNRQAKILRRQAKQMAIEAGLRKHAELTGRLPASDPQADQANLENLKMQNPPRHESSDESDSDSMSM